MPSPVPQKYWSRLRLQLVKRVSENILALNQDFWLRMASRSDSGDAETKERIASLSKAIMTITETLVKMTENQLDDSSELMVEILTAAADEQGHWDLPLAPDKITALKEVTRTFSLFLKTTTQHPNRH